MASRGKTSAKVKNANAKKNYDRFPAFVPKGLQAYYVKESRAVGMKSLNSYIAYCMDKEIMERKGLNSLYEEKEEYLAAAKNGNENVTPGK